jgi:pimeloyl-ACP methyl ester carboxylesterase
MTDNLEASIPYDEAGALESSSAGSQVLLHGLGGSRHQWREVQRRLAETSYSIALDIPGFGESRTDWRTFDVESASEKIVSFCRARNLGENCTLVSHSIGSVVAGSVAAKAPEIFTKVILVSGTLFRASEITQNPLSGLSNIRVGSAVAAQFAAGMVPLTGPVRKAVSHNPILRCLTLWPFVAHPGSVDPELLSEALENAGSIAVLKILLRAREIDYLSILTGIPQPVDLLWGESDRLITAHDIRRARRLLKVVRMQAIPKCGHWPMVEAAAETAEFILALRRT